MIDPRGRHLGTWAFVANRLTGLGLVAYLYLHLVILSTLLRGPEAWDGLVELFRRPLFLVFDVLLVAGILAGLVILVAAVRIFVG
jgi:succinate dehydrogenase / fumarate reductase, cytochrome b subunit